MASDSRLGQAWSNFQEKLAEQVWFQQLKAKWEELDPQSRMYLKYASIGVAVFGSIGLVLTAMLNVRSARKELAEKQELLQLIVSGNEELRRLRESTPAAASGGRPGEEGGPWAPYIESTAATAGVDKSALQIGDEKSGTASATSKEALLDVSLKHVSIKQIVRMAFYLESGSRPVKLRNLEIDTKADPQGYMDARLSLSGFSLKPAQ